MFQADYRARLAEPSDIVAHLPYLYDVAAGADVIELGVRSGNSTAAFIAAVEEHGGHVWSVDPVIPSVPDYWFDSDQWDCLIGDDLDPIILSLLPDRVDIVFIDTVHTYRHTAAELDAYAGKIRPGGVFLLHDVELDYAPGDPGPPQFPVRAAVDEFVAATGWKVEFHEGCYGLGVIHKPEAT